MKIEDILNLKVKTKLELFQLALDMSSEKGHCLEFGVWKGGSINHLAKLDPNRIFYGFDSFEGLPEDWNKGSSVYKKGHFSISGLPDVRPNVELIKGWFEETIPSWKAENPGPVSFLHIDSDLYSSCKTALEELNERIIPKTIILFDELCDFTNGSYSEWENHEWNAANEWEKNNHRVLTPIARTNHFQVLTQVGK